jgi:hypothetical protein
VDSSKIFESKEETQIRQEVVCYVEALRFINTFKRFTLSKEDDGGFKIGDDFKYPEENIPGSSLQTRQNYKLFQIVNKTKNKQKSHNK